ncbi:MAG TPA: hypothetical protein VIV60_15740, partial [Polyangiaceae bacterium]
MNRQVDEQEALDWLRDAASEEPAIPAAVEARVWSRLSNTVGALAVGQLGVTTAMSEPTTLTTPMSEPTTLTTAVSEPATLTSAVSEPATLTSGVWRRVIASRLALWSAPALVVGAASGVVGHAALTKEKTSIVYVDRLVAPPKPAPAASVESLVLEPNAASTSSAPKSSEPNHHATPTSQGAETSASATMATRGEGAMARERALLDPARSALTAGEPALALERIAR